MVRPTLVILTGLAALPLAACNKPPAPAPAAGAPAGGEPRAADPSPSCSIESVRDHKLDDGTEVRVWDLKANGLKALTARLLVATDGKVQTANEVTYKWEKWEDSAPAATGQLVLLMQDGKAFGVKDKRLPLMGLDLHGTPSQSKIGKRRGLFLEGELHPRLSTSATQGTRLGKQTVIYAQLFVPNANSPGNFSLGSDVESVATASKDGRTVLAVVLEWSPP